MGYPFRMISVLVQADRIVLSSDDMNGPGLTFPREDLKSLSVLLFAASRGIPSGAVRRDGGRYWAAPSKKRPGAAVLYWTADNFLRVAPEEADTLISMLMGACYDLRFEMSSEMEAGLRSTADPQDSSRE
jgi:hypothetical protein